MVEINNPLVIKKYGNHVTLNMNNIKDIYFLTSCNTSCVNTTIEEFIEKNVGKENVLKWNDIYINSYLDKIEKLLIKDNIETIRSICKYFKIAMSIYTIFINKQFQQFFY